MPSHVRTTNLIHRRSPMTVIRMLSLLGALVLLGAHAANAGAQGPEKPDKVRVVKFRYDLEPAIQIVVVFKYHETQPAAAEPRNYVKRLVGLPGETIVIKDGVLSPTPTPIIERITIDGGKVEIRGDAIKIEGGKVTITRQSK